MDKEIVLPTDTDDDQRLELRDWTTEQLLELGSRLDDEIEARTAELVAPIKARLDVVKLELRGRAIAASTTLSSEAGRVEFVKPGERVTWDDLELLRFAADLADAQPALFHKLMACRTVAPVEASARVRFAPASAPKAKG